MRVGKSNQLIQHPTIDYLVNERGGSTVFFHLDLSKGYHQDELKESSRNITTFSTHIGLYRRRGLLTERGQRLKYPMQGTIREHLTQDLNGAFNDK